MSYRKKVEKKLKRKEKSYEIKQLMKEKRGEEYEVLEARARKITAEYTSRFYDITKARIHRTLNGVLYPFATNFS